MLSEKVVDFPKILFGEYDWGILRLELTKCSLETGNKKNDAHFSYKDIPEMLTY